MYRENKYSKLNNKIRGYTQKPPARVTEYKVGASVTRSAIAHTFSRLVGAVKHSVFMTLCIAAQVAILLKRDRFY